MVSLFQDFSIKHLRAVRLSSFLFNQESSAKAAPLLRMLLSPKQDKGRLVGGLAIGHITHIMEKAKVVN